MAVSDAQKRAANKYIKEHMSTLACKVRKEQAVAFKAHCERQGSTSNTILKEFVLGCIGERDTSQEATERPISHFEGEVVSLSSETFKAVQEASEATGETQTEFVTRAVGIQAQRDKATLKLGINPATGDKLEPDRKGGEQNE